MAINRRTRYPSNFDPVSLDQPQGAFRNATTSESTDGSFNEKDWANDWSGFFGACLEGYDHNTVSVFPDPPNTQIDTARASQVYDCLMSKVDLNIDNKIADIQNTLDGCYFQYYNITPFAASSSAFATLDLMNAANNATLNSNNITVANEAITFNVAGTYVISLAFVGSVAGSFRIVNEDSLNPSTTFLSVDMNMLRANSTDPYTNRNDFINSTSANPQHTYITAASAINPVLAISAQKNQTFYFQHTANNTFTMQLYMNRVGKESTVATQTDLEPSS